MDELSISKKYDEKILAITEGRVKEVYNMLISSDLLTAAQAHSNIVSIKRLQMNDHGPVHMRKVTYYSLLIAQLLNKHNIRFSGQVEGWCTIEDSLIAIVISAFMHDIGMSIHRERHEFFALLLINDVLTELLDHLYLDDVKKKFGLRSLIFEAISGHMGHQPVASIEAGILLVADGCDLEFGRAKPAAANISFARVGDIHRYSALTITNLEINEGIKKPIKITIYLKELAGFFQIEETLLHKVGFSTIKDLIEVEAITENNEVKRYL